MIASQISEDPAEMENASEPTEDFAWEVPEPRPRLNRAGRVRRMRRRSRRGGVGEEAFRGGAVRGGPRDRTEAYEEEGGEDSGRPVLRGQRRGEPYRVRGRFFRGPRRAYPRRDPDGRTQRGLWRGPRLSQTQLEPTQPMIKEFGHKFDYYVKDDESFSSSVEPYDPATSKILMIQNDIVPFKDFSTDPKSIQLFTAMVEEATIHPSLPGQTFEEVVEDLVTAMWHAAETDRLSTQQSSSSASSYSSDDADDSFDNGPGNKSGNYLATQSSASVLQSDATLNLRLKLDKKYQSNADLATPFSASARQRDASLKIGTKADRNLNRRYCLKSMNAGAEGGHQRDGQSSTELSSARVQFQEPKPLTPCGCGWVEDRDWLEFKDKMEATAPKRDTTDIESSDEPFFIDSRAKAKNLNRLQRQSAQYYRRRGREIERYYSEKLASFSGDGVPFHNCLDVSGKPKDLLETQDQSSRFCDKRKQTVLSSDSPRCSRRVSHEGNTCKVTVVLPASGSNNSHNLDLSYQRQALRLDKLLSTSPLQLVFQKFHSCQQVSTSHHDGLADNSSSKPGIHRTPKPLPTNDDDNNSKTGIHKTPKMSPVNNDNNSNTGIHRTPKTPPTNDDGDYNRSAKVKPDPPSGGSSDSSESSSSSSSEESSSDDKSSADSQIHMDQEFTVDLAVAQIFTHHIGTNPQRALQGTNFSDEYGIMFDDMWLCLLCEISSVRKRHIGLARLESSMYLIPSCQEARFLIIIISNPAEKGTRSGLEAGRYFATLMCSPDFRQRMIKANTVDLMRELLIEESMMLERAHKFEAEKELEMFDTIKGGPGFSLKELFYPPFAGIRADLARRIPHYLSDYSDGVLGFKTLQKLFAAVLCLYFACILPLIALGYLLSTSTKGRIDTHPLHTLPPHTHILFRLSLHAPHILSTPPPPPNP
ncbi:uncharacterized protein LOC101857435, partial [Aplysia californica]|uniref:Uncharacterized protein LOC101857435 n=1 Tax=Aplysia californica TaxID=6500 RepID=A0ABM1W019_APLCA